jgi:hypothetical protein|nr:MAG TPA: YadA-like protein [Crassvirales sp.]
MTKFVDSLGLKRLVTKIAEAVGNGTWLPVKKGEGEGSVVMGENTIAYGSYSHAEGSGNHAMGSCSHAEGSETNAEAECSHAEGLNTIANGEFSHVEGYNTEADGKGSHAQGSFNYSNPFFIDTVGVGNNSEDKKNASVIYVGRDELDEVDPSDPKNGYQYLLGIGGYQGQDIAESMKSVQEVIADLEKEVAATETMTVEDIREIMSA